MEVFGDLYRTLDDKAAEALSAAVALHRKSRRGRVSELKSPWAGCAAGGARSQAEPNRPLLGQQSPQTAERRQHSSTNGRRTTKV